MLGSGLLWPDWAVLWSWPLSGNCRNLNFTFMACPRDPGGTSGCAQMSRNPSQKSIWPSESSQVPDEGKSHRATVGSLLSLPECLIWSLSNFTATSDPTLLLYPNHGESNMTREGGYVAFLEMMARTGQIQGKGMVECFLRLRDFYLNQPYHL